MNLSELPIICSMNRTTSFPLRLICVRSGTLVSAFCPRGEMVCNASPFDLSPDLAELSFQNLSARSKKFSRSLLVAASIAMFSADKYLAQGLR